MSLSYTTGNPNNLTAGAAASMNDIQGPFTDIRTWANGNVDFTNLSATVQSDYNHVCNVTALASPADIAVGTYIITKFGTVPQVVPANWLYSFYLDPADYALSGRTAKYRLRVRADVNATGPGITYTLGLYPATITRGGAGVDNTIGSLGVVVTGSTVAFASPAANSTTIQNSGDFTGPAAGSYVIAITTTSGPLTNSRVNFSVDLQRRTV